MIAALLPARLPVLGDLFKRWFPDPAEAAKAQQDMVMALLSQQASLNAAAGDIIKAEAQSEHLLAACWRPILMLTFGGLIVARWLGWSAPGISEAEVLKLWDIVQLGLGGYVIGRSIEKVAPQIAAAVAPRR
ncbi:3TM-type holin [Rhodovarius sp.]|uniref:3TM-type holin n=1 Tax=Rhodovarius sp. TaxID=2972673 RepID=UPI00334291E5